MWLMMMMDYSIYIKFAQSWRACIAAAVVKCRVEWKEGVEYSYRDCCACGRRLHVLID